MPETLEPLIREQSVTVFRRLLQDHLPELRRRFNVDTLGVFGSYVRGEQKPQSDLDVLVSYSKTPSLFKIVELEQYLSDLLGIKVDLVLRSCLKPVIGQRILAEVVEV